MTPQITRRTNWKLSMASRDKRRAPEHKLTVIGMSHFLPMLICLVIGTFVSMIIFFSEMAVKKRVSIYAYSTVCHLKNKILLMEQRGKHKVKPVDCF